MNTPKPSNQPPKSPSFKTTIPGTSSASAFFQALAVLVFGLSTATAEITPYSWQRFDVLREPGLDATGLGHIFGNYTPGGNVESPGGSQPVVNNISVGGPLGPDGIFSYTAIRSRAQGGNAGCFFREPSPVSTRNNWALTTKVNTNSWGNLFQTNRNWAIECWVLPTRNGANNQGTVFANGVSRNARSTGMRSGVVLSCINGTNRLTDAARNDGHVWLRAQAHCEANVVDTNGNTMDFYIGPPLLIKTPSNAAWIHAAIVRDEGRFISGEGTGFVTFYTNGVEVAHVPSWRVVHTNDFSSPAFAGLQDSSTTHANGGIGLPANASPYDGYMAELRWSYFAPGSFSVTNLLTRRVAPGSPTVWSGPVVISDPQNITVWEGAAAPFNVFAATDTQVTYQWQRNSTNILNATNRIYVLENTSVGADNLAQFRCILSSPNSLTATSAVATVTVQANVPGFVNGYSNAVMSEASLVAYFPVDGSAGTTLNNVKDGGHNGIITNAPFAFRTGDTNRAVGKQALSLNSPNMEYTGGYGLGTNGNGYVEIAGDNPAYDFANSGGNGTLEAVVYMDESATRVLSIEKLCILSSATFPGNFDYYNFSADATGFIYFQNSTLNLGQRLWTVPGGLVGKRTHLAFVFSNTTNLTCYANGVSLGTTTIPGLGNTPPSAYQPITIGMRGGGIEADGTGYFQNAWRGSVDDVAIYTNALSAATIDGHYYTMVNGGGSAGPSVVSITPSKTLYLGYPVQVLQVIGGGTPPLSYQWRAEGVDLVGETNATLSVPSLPPDVYNYTAVITNTVSPFATTSAPVVLTVVPPTGYAQKVYASSGGAPKAFYPLNESSGTTVFDWAGTHDGVISGGYTLGGVGPAAGTGSIKMYGTNTPNPSPQPTTRSQVTIPYYPELNPENGGNFTHEFWFKPSSKDVSSGTVCSTYYAGNSKAGMSTLLGNGGDFIYDSNNNLNNWTMVYGKYNNPKQGGSQVGGVIPATVGEWQHIAAVADGMNSVVTIYVNGMADYVQTVAYVQHPGDGSITGGVNQNYFAPLILGNFADGLYPMAGSLSQVAIYDYALTYQDITNHTSQIWTQAIITLQPVAVTNVESLGTVTLSAKAAGVPLSYEWLKNGSPLSQTFNLDGSVHYPLVTNAGGASQGVSGPTLVISQPRTNDSGTYQLKVYNPLNTPSGFTNTAAVFVRITNEFVLPVVTNVAMRSTVVSGPVMDDATLIPGNPTPANLFLVQVRFSERMDSASVTNPANYRVLLGGTVNVAVTNVIQANSLADAKFGADYRAVGLVTAGLLPGTNYTVIVTNVYDQASFSNKVANNTNTFRTPTLAIGSAIWNYYYQVGTGAFGSLSSGTNSAFPYVPQFTTRLTNFSSDTIGGTFLSINSNATFTGQADNYVATMTAWVTPTNTGWYQFWLSGDDQARLYLNPNGSSPAGAIYVADRARNLTPSYFFEANTIPVNFRLTNGVPYFMQVVQLDGTGNDGARVGWRYLGTGIGAGNDEDPVSYDGLGNNGAWIVNSTNVPPISGNFLSAYTFGAPTITVQPTNLVVAAGTATNLTVGAVTNTDSGSLTYQWQQNNLNTGGNTNRLFFTTAFTSYSTNWQVLVSDGVQITPSTTVSVQPPSTPPALSAGPISRAVPQGLRATNTVTATSVTGQTNFQWRLSGVNLTNSANILTATTRTMTITSMDVSNAGPYVVVVDDGFGRFVTSSPPAVLTIANNPVISNSISGASMNMAFPSQVGPQYVVEFKNQLTNGVWNLLTTTNGTGLTISVPVGTTNAQRYFRIRMQ